MNYAGKFGSSGLDSLSHSRVDLDSLAHQGHAEGVTIPDAHLLFSGDYHKSGQDLVISDETHRVVVPNYFHGDKRPGLFSPDGAPMDPRVVDALTGHTEYAQAGAAAPAKLIGHVAKMSGSASIVRNGVTVDLQNGDAVYQTDVVQTGSNSTLGLVLNDGTTFNLSANARLMLNDLTYDATSTHNTSLFTLVQGAATFVAGQVAKTGDMKVGTPVATMGIRGTAVTLDIDSTDGKVSISVIDQHDNVLHSVEVFDSQGNLVGMVTSSGGSLTLTPTASFNVIAQMSDKTPAQVAAEFNAFQGALNTYDLQKAIDPNLPQHTDNANPQTRYASVGSSSPYAVTQQPSTDNGGSPNQNGGSGTPTDPHLFTDGGIPTGTTPGPPTFVVTPAGTGVPLPSIPFPVTPSPVAPITTGAIDHTGPVMSASGNVVYDPDGVIYFYDRATGTTTQVTPANDGFTYSGQTISSDGRYVVYQGTDGTHTYVFVWGTDPSDPAHFHKQIEIAAGSSPAVSGDGSTILVQLANGGIGILDLQGNSKGTITPAVVGATGALLKPAISADGHIIAFWSADSALGGSGHLFTYNVSTGVVSEIASTSTGAGTTAASISADGHYVVYQSQAASGHTEISMYDLTTGHVVFTTANASETLAGDSHNPVISPDGHFIIFTSTAQLTPDDTNNYADTYVVNVTDPAHPVFKLVSAGSNASSDGGVAISAGGLYFAFASNSSFSGGPSGANNVYFVDPTSGHGAIIQETASSPDHLTASGEIQITGGTTGVSLSVTDASGNPTDLLTAAFDSNGNVQWSFSEAKSDFAALHYGDDLAKVFNIVLSYNGGTTTVPVTVAVQDLVQPVVVPADVAPVAHPVTLADAHGDGSYTITPDTLLKAVADIDSPSLSITNVSIKAGGGTLVHNEDGSWTYTPAAGFHGEVVFNYTASDGTLTAASTASLSVVNDPATITGQANGSVVEDTSVTASGTLTVHDIDAGEAAFMPVASAALTGAYGNFTFDATTGAWTYTLDHARADGLSGGQVVHEQLTVASVDGTAQQVIDVTVTGSDDAPVASPVTLADAHGDGSYTIAPDTLLKAVADIDSSSLSITDVSIKTGGGTLVHNGDGSWTYTPAAGFHGEVVFDYTASDGTLTATSTASLSVQNDPATITGQASGNVVEDTSVTANGTLTVHDIDAGEAAFKPVASAALAGAYGNFTFDSADGAWTYTLDHARANGLSDGQVVHDQLTVASVDGTAQQVIDVTVTGSNDAPVITEGTVATGSITLVTGDGGHSTVSAGVASELATSGLISNLPNGTGFGPLATGSNDAASNLPSGTGFGTLAMGPNDDGSSGAVDITSVFGSDGINFFGHHYTSLYINNNGNITFSSPLSAYTPEAIGAGFDSPIMAPFWADVDTRGHGQVFYDLDQADGIMTITWDDVGYYSEATDKLNSFQVVLINEGGGNFDIEYRYGQIQWTTGSASGGSDGLGGTPARIGYTSGDGSHYYEVPQSGNQNALLTLPQTAGNTGIDGVDVFNVHNGEVDPTTLTTNGTIDFADPDLLDTHTIQSVTYTGSGTALGTLTLAQVSDTTGSGTGGEFTWTYDASSAAVRSALDGIASHSKIETFDVVISDGHGGTVTQTVSVTLTEPVATPTLTITVLTSDGLDFQNDSPLKEMGAGTVQSGGSSTTFTVVDPASHHEFVVDGTSFTYADGAVTGGIITSFHEFATGDTPVALADFSGLSVDAPAWMSAVQQAAAGDKTAVEALTSNYSYIFNGGAGADNFGSAGHADTLTGTGQDVFDGGGAPAGSHDTLTGGAGSTFMFGAGYGALTITNFDQANGTFDPNQADHIQLNGLSAPLSVSYADGNALLDFGNGDVITLLNVSQTQYQNLSGSEFTSGGNGGGGNSNGGPVIAGAGNTVTFAGTPVLLDPSVTVTDDTGTVSSVNVWISSGVQNGDTLSINGSLDGDLVYSDGTIHYHFDDAIHSDQTSIFLSGIAGTPSSSDFDAALQLIQFAPGAIDGARTVTWAAYDNVLHSPTVTTTVEVGPVLNSFVLTVGEGGTTVLSSSDFNVSDPGYANLTYTVSDVAGGHFEVFNGDNWVSAPSGGFTTAQIAAHDVEFVQNGTATVPSFLMHVSDPGNASPDIPAMVSLEIAGENSETITFAGSSGTLQLDDPQSFSGKIAGITGSGNVLDINGFSAGTTTAFTGSNSYDGESNTTTLTVADSSDGKTETFKLAGDLSGSSWTVSDDHRGGVDIVDPPAGGAVAAVGGTAAANPGPTTSQTIVADASNQTLTGTGASNNFAFDFTGIGHDTVTNFHPAADTLQFGGGIFANAQAALNAAQDDGHGNTVITLDASDAIILSGVAKAQLHAADFHFA
ncbi:hypothetical protein UP09_09085 [Bradyrhizobium sp. LTSP885]|nr:hypothetical protein UP09_09085 [Bradyrhizobium sp. LTSP885]